MTLPVQETRCTISSVGLLDANGALRHIWQNKFHNFGVVSIDSNMLILILSVEAINLIQYATLSTELLMGHQSHLYLPNLKIKSSANGEYSSKKIDVI